MAAPAVDPQVQQKKIAFTILEYLQDVRSTANNDVSESLEVAIQCISDSFGVSLTSEEHKAQYSIQPLTLSGVFGLGIARKEQIEAALASANLPTQTAAAPQETELDKKFAEYCRLLTEKGYFAGSVEGTPEYQTKYTKAKAKFMEKYQTPSATPATPSSPSTPTPAPTSPSTPAPAVDQSERVKKAEEFKNLGNQKLSANQFQEAVDNYSKAIEFDPTNAIYYANRAAGYSHLNKHQLAIDDCNQAISRNPNYGKAYSRLGLANFSLGKYAEAAANYKRALELDPTNVTIKQSLESAEKKLRETTNPAATRPGFPDGLADIINNPLFQNLAQNLSGGNAGGAGGAGGAANAEGGEGENAAGGMPDVSQLLNNPALLNMAQNVMSQPGFSDMLNNPAMMNMAQSFMQNPEALSGILQGVFGNKGGNPGSGNPQ